MGVSLGVRVSVSQRLNVLSGGISLLDVTVDKGGNGCGRGVDLVLSLGDSELGEKLLKNLYGLRVLALDYC